MYDINKLMKENNANDLLNKLSKEDSDKIKSLLNDEEKLKSTIEELAEEALQDILDVDPRESGIEWEEMTEREKEDLKQECREMFKYEALIGEYNVIQKEEK